MSVFDRACLIIYRFAEKGLEIFLLNEEGIEEDLWSIPGADQIQIPEHPEQNARFISLDPVENKEGQKYLGVAVEGDWHDIPSLRSLVKKDVQFVKDKLKEIAPELEQGTFVAVKEAFKKVLPHEYALLKELKDILTDRNLVKYL